MSIRDEFRRVDENIKNVFEVFRTLGADIPTVLNSANLASTASTIKAVLFYPQTLTEEEKAQARANIGASAANDVSGTTTVKIGEVSLPASSWTGGNNLWSQVVEIDGVTERSQVELTPSVEQLVIFYEKDLTFVTENDGGEVTVYAIGQRPANNYVVQVTITEVLTDE